MTDGRALPGSVLHFINVQLTRRGCVWAALLTLMWIASADAQVVRGRVLDDRTSQPIEGAFIIILDAQARTLASVITDDAGRFVVDPSPSGRYSIRIERIGFATFTSEPFDVSFDSIAEREFRILPRAVTLPAIDVVTESRCTRSRDLSAATFTIWDEARKTLALASWTARSDSIVYDVVEYRHKLDVRLDVVEADTQVIRLRAQRGPFASIAVDSLMTRGFVQPAPEGRGWLYFAPDADVLLSDAFHGSYCFRSVQDRSQPELAGLDFEPAGPEEVPGIEGTLWLDRESFELRSIEFSFTRVPFRVGVPGGGRLEFQSIPGGGSIVRRWSLRVPILRAVGDRVPIRSVLLDGYIETIREISGATRSDGTPIPLPRRQTPH